MQELLSRQQLREFIKDKNLKTADDAKDALKELFKGVIQEMLEAELDTELGYEKHEKAEYFSERTPRS